MGDLKDFLGDTVKRVLFVPYAGVTVDWDTYTKKVRERYAEIGYELQSVHEVKDPVAALHNADAVAVGGGNTFHLLETMYANNLVQPMRELVEAGLPYMGWSAGSNVACPTIKTTNDMPIVQPRSFDALAVVPFQINPHYTDKVLPEHQGETRADRLAEFIEVNRNVNVVGLLEGSILRVEGKSIRLLGGKNLLVFRHGQDTRELTPDDSFDFLWG
jgi:dipeptidase E